MHEEDPASPPFENSPRQGGDGAETPPLAESDPIPRPGHSGQGPGEKLRSRPVERPVTIGQLQRILDMRLGFTVSENTLERWCRECKIHAYRLGAAWRIPRDEVDRILQSAQAGESF